MDGTGEQTHRERGGAVAEDIVGRADVREACDTNNQLAKLAQQPEAQSTASTLNASFCNDATYYSGLNRPLASLLLKLPRFDDSVLFLFHRV